MDKKKPATANGRLLFKERKKMRILAIGDLVSPAAVQHLTDRLWPFRKERNIQFVLVNAENASTGNGLAPTEARQALDAGADVLTGGNHIFSDVASGVGCRTVYLGWIFSRKGTSPVCTFTSVGVYNDFSSGNAGISMRTPDYEFSGRIDM